LEPSARQSDKLRERTAQRQSIGAFLMQPLITAVLIAAAYQILASLPIEIGRGLSVFLPEQVAEFELADTSWQRLLYQLLLALTLALTGLTYLVYRRRRFRARRIAVPRLLANAAPACVIVFGLLAPGGVSAAPIFAAASLVTLLGAIGLSRLPRRGVRRVLAIGCIGVLLLLVVPGLYRPIVLRSLDNVETVSAHWVGLLGPASKLALGAPVGHVLFIYGGFPILAWLLPFGDLTRFDGVFDIVLVWQLLFLAGLMACAWLYDRSKDLLLAVFVVLLVAPFVATYYRSMYYPNESGIRYVGFILALLLLRWPAFGGTAGVGLGAAAAALIFYNPETGIAICLGLAFRQIVAGLSARRRILDAISYSAAFLLGLALGAIALAALVFGLIGVKPGLFSPYITSFSGGYGGLRFHPEPCSFLMMLCGIAAMLRAAARAAQGRLTEAQARSVAIAVTLLVWLSYYINRADPWNLWGLVLLLLFAAADWISLRRWRASVGRLRQGRLTLAAAMVLGVAVPFALQNAVDTAGALFRGWPADLQPFSGVLMPAPIRAALEVKTATLKSLAAQGRVVYLTIDPSFVMLGSGVDSGLAEGDVFSDTLTEDDVRRVRDEILANNPDLILFDSPDRPNARAYPRREHLLARLQPELQDRYVADRSDGGWDIWARRPTSPG
jgi:hypothetical protein